MEISLLACNAWLANIVFFLAVIFFCYHLNQPQPLCFFIVLLNLIRFWWLSSVMFFIELKKTYKTIKKWYVVISPNRNCKWRSWLLSRIEFDFCFGIVTNLAWHRFFGQCHNRMFRLHAVHIEFGPAAVSNSNRSYLINIFFPVRPHNQLIDSSIHFHSSWWWSFFFVELLKN